MAKTTIYIPFGEAELEIEGHYTPPSKGSYSSAPEDCYEATAEMFEVNSIKLEGKDVTEAFDGMFALRQKGCKKHKYVDWITAKIWNL